jgi:tetratricopeptide (TPR) repeat protein
MPHKPGNLSQFWQELRRRKVVRVITVYAAAAFVIRYVSVKLYYNQGRFDEALLDFQKMSELQEDHPWLERYDFKLYYQLGDKEKAFKVLWRRMTAPPVIHDLDLVKKIFDESGLKGIIEYDNEVIIGISEGRDGNSSYLASTYGLIGEDEKAMDWLERAFKVNKISPEISYNIHFKNLHDNPRYIAILEQMGLPPP